MPLAALFRRARVRPSRRPSTGGPPRWRPRLECLEDRRLPTAYVVNSLADGAPALDGQLTLREAITAASSNAASGDAPAGSTGLDTITFAPSLAYGTIKLDPTQFSLFYGVGGGDLNISGPVPNNPAGLIISGQDQTRVLQLGSFAGAAQQFTVDNVSIDSLTMTHGFGNAACFLNAAMNATLTAVAVTNSQNTQADPGGGGIENAATLTLKNCTVANNIAEGPGAGILNDSGATLSVSLSRITSNVSDLGFGGGIANAGGTLAVRTSTIAGNTSWLGGGGLECDGGGATVLRSTVAGNYVANGDGGGIKKTGAADLQVLNCSIVGNVATGPNGFGGGGMLLSDAGTVTVVNSTIVQNAATNFTNGSAGGIGKLTTNCVLVVSNTIVTNNSSVHGTAQDVDLANINNGAGNLISGFARLTPLQDNGGPTLTMAPLPGSAAIDGGNNAFATVTGLPGGAPLIRDQRGARRLIDGDHNGSRTVDIGAVEFSPGPIHPLIAAADAGSSPEVKVYDGLSGQIAYDFLAFAPGFGGGVRVAAGDVTADGVDDYITGAGPSGGPQVNLYDGATGALITAFFAFTPTFTGGVFVATGDVNKDGFADVIVSEDAGGTPSVAVFSGKTLAQSTVTLLAAFNAYDPGFAGGVRIAAGDLNGDGFADVITGKGPGTAPRVRAFDGKVLMSNQQSLLYDFFAYAQTFTGGVYVAAGDTNGDGTPDIITGAGAGGGPAVNVFSGKTGAPIASFFAYGVTFAGGVRVGAADLNGDGIADIITGRGPGGEPTVKVFDGPTQQALNRFDAFDLAFTGGVFVGGA